MNDFFLHFKSQTTSFVHDFGVRIEWNGMIVEVPRGEVWEQVPPPHPPSGLGEHVST